MKITLCDLCEKEIETEGKTYTVDCFRGRLSNFTHYEFCKDCFKKLTKDFPEMVYESD